MLISDDTDFKVPNTANLYYFEFVNNEAEDVSVYVDTPVGSIKIAKLPAMSSGIIQNVILPYPTFRIKFSIPPANPIHFGFAVMPTPLD